MGKTCRKNQTGSFPRKHPHGRGEDVPPPLKAAPEPETPPRAWGRRGTVLLATNADRNTPTGVGKTESNQPPTEHRQKHPHGRGEDSDASTTPILTMETPPRAWGRPQQSSTTEPRIRNTPTGVGKTNTTAQTLQQVRKHPHGRGEDLYAAHWSGDSGETPPRAWGRLKAFCHRGQPYGNTPTGVGKTSVDSQFLSVR